MAELREITQLGNEILRIEARKVELPISQAVESLIEDMMLTMLNSQGVGIAAPQVGESLDLFIVASKPSVRYPRAPVMEPEVVVNPEILEVSDELVKGWEGCLSIPGIRGLVPRHQRIKVSYWNLAGEQIVREFDDFVARVFQHEFDHLRGRVFLDRLESHRDIITESEFRKLVV
jgi:peptide deformylase